MTSPATPSAFAPPRTSRVPGWLVDVAAIALIVLFTIAPIPGEGPMQATAPTLIVAGLAGAAMLLRRRWPVAVLSGVVVLFAVAALTALLAPGVTVAAAIAMFTVTSRVARRQGLWLTAATVAIVVGFSVISYGNGAEPRPVQYALAVLVGAAAGDAARSRRAYIEAVTERAVRAEQTREAEARRRVSEERLKIARDLHDAVAHQISVISLNAGVASANFDTRPEQAKESLTTIRSASRAVLSEIGGLLEVLRAGDEAPTAPQPGLEQLPELVGRFAADGLDVSLRSEGDLSAVPSASAFVAYRVVQEALTNAHKHSADRRAHVLIAVASAELKIVVSNPADSARVGGAHGSGLGLVGLRERVSMVRGTIEAGPAPGGWRVSVTLPLSDRGVSSA